MAKPPLLGMCDCPECGLKDCAEVRNDKSGAPYRYCTDCSAQYFTRGRPVSARNLLEQMRPIAPPVTDISPPINTEKTAAKQIRPEEANKIGAAQALAQAVKKTGFSLGNL